MLKIGNVITSIELTTGGPALSVWSLVKELRLGGTDAKIITYKPQSLFSIDVDKKSLILIDRKPIENKFSYSPLFSRIIKKTDFAIFHGHGIWQYPVHCMARIAQKRKIQYIISPRGMLFNEALNKSKWFKRVAWIIFQKSDLKKATVIHATSKEEFAAIRKAGFNNYIALIPNAIDVNIENTVYKKTKWRRVGFIGRFAKIKNIEILLQAYAKLEKSIHDIELVLIGDGPVNYKRELIEFSKVLGIKNIIFTGFLTGKKREAYFRTFTLLVLPSKSENFGMVVPEALLRKIPVIASKGTPWEELVDYNCGWWVDIGVEPLKIALEEALSFGQEELVQMGINGRNLVENKYSSEVVANQMLALYRWILNKGIKPPFVYK